MNTQEHIPTETAIASTRLRSHHAAEQHTTISIEEINSMQLEDTFCSNIFAMFYLI